MAKVSPEQRIEDLIKMTLKTKDAGELMNFCEGMEEQMAVGQHDLSKLGKAMPCSLLMSYLIEGDLNNARFCWKRFAEPFKHFKELEMIWGVGRHMWEKNYSQVYSAIEKTSWGSGVSGLMGVLSERYRQRVLELIQRSYSNLKLSDFKTFIGFGEDQIKKYLKTLGWGLKEGFVYPKRKDTNVEEKTKSINPHTVINELTKKHLFIESHND